MRSAARPLPLLAAALLLAPAPGAAQGTTAPVTRTTCARPVATAATLASPFVGLLLNGACVDLSWAVRRLEGAAPIWTMKVDQTFGAARIQLDATFDADPFIQFGVTTTNFGPGPTTYTFLFGTPIVPGPYTTATAGGSVALTAGNARNAAVANSADYPAFISGYGVVGATSINLGVDVGTTPCVTATSTTCAYGPATNTFAPANYEELEALLTYTQTDAGSVAVWNGRVEILSASTTVPEPTTVALLGGGLLALGGVGVARRRR